MLNYTPAGQHPATTATTRNKALNKAAKLQHYNSASENQKNNDNDINSAPE